VTELHEYFVAGLWGVALALAVVMTLAAMGAV
jgi:hypothetical protein